MYTIKEVDGVAMLHRSNRVLYCPFKSNLLVPTQLSNQLSIMREPCGNWCPMFDVVENSGVILHCKGVHIETEQGKTENNENGGTLKIIQ